MKYLSGLRFSKWATPVTKRRWAFVSVVLQTLNALTGWRMNGAPAHSAWMRAIS